jgi:uncharacterized membrane protein
MQESPAGVLVSREQPNESAKKDFERLVSQISMGEVKGIVVEPNPLSEDIVEEAANAMRKGAARGAVVGFLLGMVPLVTSTIVGAGAGALVAKASQIRIEKGSAPRIRFGKSNSSSA